MTAKSTETVDPCPAVINNTATIFNENEQNKSSSIIEDEMIIIIICNKLKVINIIINMQ